LDAPKQTRKNRERTGKGTGKEQEIAGPRFRVQPGEPGTAPCKKPGTVFRPGFIQKFQITLYNTSRVSIQQESFM
jgi:hypothetical protein